MDISFDDMGTLVGSLANGQDVIQEALMTVRDHLGMEIAYFSEFVDGRSVFRHVDAPGLGHLIKVGDSHDLADVYCNHILEGRLPELIPDTSELALTRQMPITSAAPIGSHVSIPVRLSDGTPFGMFCCLSPRPMPSLNERDVKTMRMFAGLVAKQVNGQLEQRVAAGAARSRVASLLANHAYKTVFQPIFTLTDMRMVGCEALSRFSPEPYRSPDKWFGEAAAVGLGLELELATIRAAVLAFETLPKDIYLALNASPEAILSEKILEVLDSRYLDRTVLEITEHSKVADYAELHRILAPIKRQGLKIAVDDAGAGYSGLQHIVQLGPDIIKLDMSLTRSLDTDPARRALATAMLFYARETGAYVIAEGVETAEELKTLRVLGVNRGQGYFLGRPGSASALHDGREQMSKAAS
jgi:EAL domain-containing protein (putative c-di-GMP-specific phosphodiesterase class I)